MNNYAKTLESYIITQEDMEYASEAYWIDGVKTVKVFKHFINTGEILIKNISKLLKTISAKRESGSGGTIDTSNPSTKQILVAFKFFTTSLAGVNSGLGASIKSFKKFESVVTSLKPDTENAPSILVSSNKKPSSSEIQNCIDSLKKCRGVVVSEKIYSQIYNVLTSLSKSVSNAITVARNAVGAYTKSISTASKNLYPIVRSMSAEIRESTGESINAANKLVVLGRVLVNNTRI